MRVKFEVNNYFEIFKEETQLSDENAIKQNISKSLRFHYGNITYQKFQDEYLKNNPEKGNPLWKGRAFLAVPKGFSYGIFKAIAHTFDASFRTIRACCKRVSGEEKELIKSRFYTAGRDLQQSFGWITALFFYKYGFYHIQEGLFQQQCYICYIEKPQNVIEDANTSDNNENPPPVDQKPPIPPHKPNAEEEILKEAADLGDILKQYELAMFYIGQKKLESAIQWFEAAAEGGHARSKNILGLFYYKGQGVKKDKNFAVKCFTRAAFLGDSAAAFNLGCCHIIGQDVEKSDLKALENFKKASVSHKWTKEKMTLRLKDFGITLENLSPDLQSEINKTIS